MENLTLMYLFILDQGNNNEDDSDEEFTLKVRTLDTFLTTPSPGAEVSAAPFYGLAYL